MKKLVIGILACAMTLSNYAVLTANASDYTEETFEDFKYIAHTDYVEISKYTKTDATSSVIVPKEIDGLPVTTIGESAFYNNQKLKSVVLPEGITDIKDEAFQNCSYLQSVTLPESLVTIGKDAFNYCSKLTSVEIPESVTDIGSNAFSLSGLTEVVIPESITVINSGTFSNCSNLKSVTFPETLTSIGYYSFSDTGLMEVTIPAKVESIGNYAFSNCSKLEKATISGINCDFSATNLGARALSFPSATTIYCYKNSLSEELCIENERAFESLGFAHIAGDANGDTIVTIADVVAISSFVGDSEKNPIDDEQLVKNADVHNIGDGLTANDVLMIQQYLAGNVEL